MASTTQLFRALAAGLCALSLAAVVPAPSGALTRNAAGQPITNKAGVTFGILAHRAGGLEWPQNSVEAYTNSVAAGFDSIETDLVFTRDGVGVMSHDDILPTRCTHAGQSIHKMTAAQVAEVRCADLAGKMVVPIPTFAQLAGILRGHETNLLLEFKSYAGQSKAGKRAWAAQGMKLVKDYGLLPQTSILTYLWADMLPTIRKAQPKIYVLALDLGTVNLDRVRQAKKLGASGFGIRMKYTSVYLAEYVKKKGMDSVPWEVIGPEQLAFTTHYGGKHQLFSTDTPTATRADLLAGKIDLNPVARPTTTTLRTPVTVSKATYAANKRHYPVVVDKAVPKPDISMLRDVTLKVKVTGGKGKGTLSLGAMSSPLSSSVKVKLPKKTHTFTLSVPLGDKGKLRISTTKKVKLAVQVVSYTRIRFA